MKTLTFLKNSLVLIFLVFSILTSSCQSISFNSKESDILKQNRRLNTAQCPVSPEFPPAFEVLKNDHHSIVFQVNNMRKLFNFSSEKYQYRVLYYHTDTKEFRYQQIAKEEVIAQGYIFDEPTQIEFNIKKTGSYTVELLDNSKTFWKQKIFATTPSENTLSEENKIRLAKQFAPYLEMSPNEIYFPTSLEYIFNKVDPDEALNEEPYIVSKKSATGGLFSFFKKSYDLSVPFKLKDAPLILPYYGHSESVLKFNGENDKLSRMIKRDGKNHPTVYYSVFENERENEIYINYHFFYAFDSKNGTEEKTVMAAHIFDRESLTVVLRKGTELPLYVIYGAHLPSQTMALLKPNSKEVLQSWKQGKVYIPWKKVPQFNNRIHAVAAQGSHGVYPVQGTYAVMLNDKIPILIEPSGGGVKVGPQFDSQTPAEAIKYNLIGLNLSEVTTNCNSFYNILAYSGYTVDVLGPTNATFPPFTEREADYKNYLDPNMHMFDLDKIK